MDPGPTKGANLATLWGNELPKRPVYPRQTSGNFLRKKTGHTQEEELTQSSTVTELQPNRSVDEEADFADNSNNSPGIRPSKFSKLQKDRAELISIEREKLEVYRKTKADHEQDSKHPMKNFFLSLVPETEDLCEEDKSRFKMDVQALLHRYRFPDNSSQTRFQFPPLQSAQQAPIQRDGAYMESNNQDRSRNIQNRAYYPDSFAYH